MSVVPAWLNKAEPNYEGNAKVSLAQKAIEQGMWIYDKTTKILYTPTEFVWDKKVSIPLFKQHKAIMTNFELRDPGEYIKVRKEKIKQLMQEIEVMETRMKQYYKLVPKK